MVVRTRTLSRQTKNKKNICNSLFACMCGYIVSIRHFLDRTKSCVVIFFFRSQENDKIMKKILKTFISSTFSSNKHKLLSWFRRFSNINNIKENMLSSYSMAVLYLSIVATEKCFCMSKRVFSPFHFSFTAGVLTCQCGRIINKVHKQ